MRTTLATTSLAMPADQSLLVKDVYAVEGAEDNNSVVDVLKDVGGELAKVIRNTPNMTQKVVQLGTEAATGRLTKDNAVQRVTGMLGGLNNVFSKLTGPVAEKISDTFGMDPRLTNQVFTVVKDAVTGQRISIRGAGGFYGNMSNASSVTSAIQQILGNKDIFESLDLGAEAAMLGELVNQAVRAGIPSAIDVLLRNASDDSTRRYIVTRNMAPILFSGDILTMEKTLEHVHPSVIASIRPKFAQDFLANFRLPYGTNQTEYLTYKNRVISVLTRINPNWDVELRDGQPILSLMPFVRMSRDAKEIFLTSDSYALQTTIASKFGEQSLSRLVRAQYPYFPI